MVMSEPLILASASAARAAVLKQAGLTFTAMRPSVDEEALKQSLRAEGFSPRDQADALAEAKALSVSRRMPGFVIGADQMLAMGDDVFDKPQSRAEAGGHLRALRGQTHTLLTAIVIAKEGAVIWRHMETPRLTMRSFTDAFLDSYLDAIGDSACASVGAYQIEGQGAQLFTKIEGDYFSILGLPLLPLLGFLREHGIAQQ
jgi:septum formation protein